MHLEAGPLPRDYQVTLAPLPANDVLRERWLALQARAGGSAFVSWQWIGTWLETICPRRLARLLSVHHDGRLVAMGIITRRGRLFGLAPASLRLHETGSRELDSLTIEYNGLLCETGHHEHALVAVVSHLLEHERHWLTIALPGLDAAGIPMASLRALPVEIRLLSRPTHYVDLAALSAAGQQYLPSLGSKTRASVRRTQRRFEQSLGPVTLETADSPAQRLAFFRALVVQHRRYWQRKNGTDGAFGNPRVLRFHEQLLLQSDSSSGAQLSRLSAGEVPIGYAYSIVSNGTAYFYQSGICYDAATFHDSPGLLLLSHLIQQQLDDGMTRFELMAGDSPYKRRMGAQAGSMAWVSLDRIGTAARLRRIWWRLRGKRA